jgi:hypothetical protein
MKLVDLSFNESRPLKNNIGIYKIVLEVEKLKSRNVLIISLILKWIGLLRTPLCAQFCYGFVFSLVCTNIHIRLP